MSDAAPTLEQFMRAMAHREAKHGPANHLDALAGHMEYKKPTDKNTAPVDPVQLLEAKEKMRDAMAKGVPPTLMLKLIFLISMMTQRSGLTIEQMHPLYAQIVDEFENHDFALSDAAVDAIVERTLELHRERSVQCQ